MMDIIKRSQPFAALPSEVRHHVNESMATFGYCKPMLFTDSAEGKFKFNMPEYLAKEEAEAIAKRWKPSLPTRIAEWLEDDATKIARLYCTTEGANSMTYVSGAWLINSRNGPVIDLTKEPGRLPGVRDAILVVKETQERRSHKFSPIVRHPNGQFIQFGDLLDIEASRVKGLFGRCVPQQVPTRTQQLNAVRALENSGFGFPPDDNVGMQNPKVEVADRNAKCHILSPDGVALTSKPFENVKEAAEYIRHWCADLWKSQGYYVTQEWNRIPVDDLPRHLTLVPAEEMARRERKMAQGQSEEHRRHMRMGM